MNCPWCGNVDVNVHSTEERAKDDSLPDVSFVDIRCFCEECKYMFNIVGAKSLNNSKKG